MNDLFDRYVLANLVGCAIAILVHAGVWVGVLPFFVAFALFPPTLLCFGATMATHPDAHVTRIGPLVLGVRMGFGALWRTAPLWSLAIVAGFIAYCAAFFFGHRAAMTAQEPPVLFAALFVAICAHLFWSGVATRLGALRARRQMA